MKPGIEEPRIEEPRIEEPAAREQKKEAPLSASSLSFLEQVSYM